MDCNIGDFECLQNAYGRGFVLATSSNDVSERGTLAGKEN
jgi:hypothetical protein